MAVVKVSDAALGDSKVSLEQIASHGNITAAVAAAAAITGEKDIVPGSSGEPVVLEARGRAGE